MVAGGRSSGNPVFIFGGVKKKRQRRSVPVEAAEKARGGAVASFAVPESLPNNPERDPLTRTRNTLACDGNIDFPLWRRNARRESQRCGAVSVPTSSPGEFPLASESQ